MGGILLQSGGDFSGWNRADQILFFEIFQQLVSAFTLADLDLDNIRRITGRPDFLPVPDYARKQGENHQQDDHGDYAQTCALFSFFLCSVFAHTGSVICFFVVIAEGADHFFDHIPLIF